MNNKKFKEFVKYVSNAKNISYFNIFLELKYISVFFSMWVNNRLYFGGDRLFLVEREFGLNSQPHRILQAPICNVMKKVKLTFYLDFGSPWTFLGFKQVLLQFLCF